MFEEIDINIILIFAFLLSLTIVSVSIPTVIRMAKYKDLFDTVDSRKVHSEKIPRLGGMGIFTGIIISILLIVNPYEFAGIGGFAAGLVILFFIGIKDDILIISPLTKFAGQFVAALIIVIFGNSMITNLHGFFGIHEIHWVIGIPLTIFVYLTTTNAFNFIDGIDGLSASLGIIAATTFGIWFWLVGAYQMAIIAAVMVGAFLGFLRFNLFSKKNKIFMGDTGSMMLGYIISFLAIQFNEIDLQMTDSQYFILPAPAVAFGVLIIPFYDMIRVIYIRVLQRKSIFYPDKNHIHHLLLRIGLSHKQITLTLSLASILFTILVFWLSKFITIRRLLLIELLIAMVLSFIPEIILMKKNK